jgi:hypothetical protein
MEEPNWTKQITSEQVCSFFYAFSIVYAIIGAIAILFGLWNLFFGKMPLYLVTPLLIQTILTSSLAFITALFHYLICQRALLSK